MQKIRGTVFEQKDLTAVYAADSRFIAGNAMSLACAQARYPVVEIRDHKGISAKEEISADMFRQLIAASTRPKADFDIANSSGPSQRKVPTIYADLIGDRDALKDALLLLRRYIGEVEYGAERTPDFGECVRRDLCSYDGAFAEVETITPATGRPVKHLIAKDYFLPMADCFKMPHYASAQVLAWAYASERIDRPKLQPTFFRPDGTMVEGVDRRDRFFGDPAAVKYIHERLYTFGLCHVRSAQSFLWAIRKPERLIGREMFLRKNKHMDKHIIGLGDEVMANLDAIPMHSMFSYIASIRSSGSAYTPAGELPLYLVDSTSIDSAFVPSKAKLEGRVRDHDYELLCANAYCEFLRSIALYRTIADACGNVQYGWTDTVRAAPASMGPMEYISAAADIDEMMNGANEFARTLQWRSIPCDPFKVDLNGGSYELTDGLELSCTPDAIVAGVAPLLSCGNVKLLPLAPYCNMNAGFESQFISTLPFHGEVDSSNMDEALGREYMAYSMTMGETNVLIYNQMSAEGDVVVAAIKARLASKMATYLTPYYNSDALNPSEGAFHRTQWDPYATGALRPEGTPLSTAELLADWSAGIAPRAEPSNQTPVVTRSTGKFMGRMPMMLSHSPGAKFTYINELGYKAEADYVVPQRVIFDGGVTLGHRAEASDKLLSAFPQRSAKAELPIGLELKK